MSPFEQGEPCYVLVWEGLLGDFYEIDENVKITKLGQVLSETGFINITSDLIAYCKARSLDGFVVQEKFYVRRV